MACPYNASGEPICHITAHPDHPDQKFCAACNQRFIDQPPTEDSNLFVTIITVLLFLFFWQSLQTNGYSVLNEANHLEIRSLPPDAR